MSWSSDSCYFFLLASGLLLQQRSGVLLWEQFLIRRLAENFCMWPIIWQMEMSYICCYFDVFWINWSVFHWLVLFFNWSRIGEVFSLVFGWWLFVMLLYVRYINFLKKLFIFYIKNMLDFEGEKLIFCLYKFFIKIIFL